MITETTTIYVQFSGETPSRITAVFWAPQDPGYWPGIIEMQDDDPRYLAYINPPADLLAINSAKLQQFMQIASAQKTALSNRIGDLESAIDNIDIEGQEEFAATIEEQAEYPVRKAQFTKWKNYSISLGRVAGQVGWPSEAVWPAQPVAGMDLTVSATE
ncbi:tail fiber assembly protein [Pseudomonas mandelii]|uniref:tail fiber assembly protein n=1 Tax=Pseudomonas mandelii TaxID=75612 RepID=UPI001C8313E2|nr:tail fiber assembly protein [Pseudomonas mandelii]QZA99304.1 tail fiber assembly protein [Pseudomonas mandelii]